MEEAEVHALLIGAVVRLLRLRRGWTQQHLARRARLSQATFSRLESGRYEATLFDVQLLAAALEMPEADLIDFIHDAGGRAAAMAAAGVDCRGLPWWEVVHRVSGLAGVRGLVLFAVGAAAG